MSYQPFEKFLITLTSWNQVYDLPKSYENIKAVKIKWLTYQTVTDDNKTLMLQIPELGSCGTSIQTNNSNTKYFLIIPLDLSAVVSNIYTNFTSEFDKRYTVPITVNQLTFKTFINDSPASDIDVNHPVVLELGLYD